MPFRLPGAVRVTSSESPGATHSNPSLESGSALRLSRSPDGLSTLTPVRLLGETVNDSLLSWATSAGAARMAPLPASVKGADTSFHQTSCLRMRHPFEKKPQGLPPPLLPSCQAPTNDRLPGNPALRKWR